MILIFVLAALLGVFLMGLGIGWILFVLQVIVWAAIIKVAEAILCVVLFILICLGLADLFLG